MACQCSWAGVNREGCMGANDGSMCFHQCCTCDCSWAATACNTQMSDGSYCWAKCCPNSVSFAYPGAAAAGAAPIAAPAAQQLGGAFAQAAPKPSAFASARFGASAAASAPAPGQPQSGHLCKTLPHLCAAGARAPANAAAAPHQFGPEFAANRYGYANGPGTPGVPPQQLQLQPTMMPPQLSSGAAFGPVGAGIAGAAQAGWALDNGVGQLAGGGRFQIMGNTRAYLVEDFGGRSWGQHRYARFDLKERALRFTLDLSNVPCGCLACVYLVAMDEPNSAGPNYCDMAENVKPGYGGGTCTEIDLLEANNHAMQTALHTQTGGSFGSGQCDRNGCFARVGGPQAPSQLYGRGKRIDSMRAFEVEATVSGEGGLLVTLQQDGRVATSFDTSIAGNPQGKGVPRSAMHATKAAMGKLALVASLWSSPDLSWLDGSCNQCSLPQASFAISNLATPLRVSKELDLAVALAADLTNTDPNESYSAYELIAFVVVSTCGFLLVSLAAWAALIGYGYRFMTQRLKAGKKYVTVPGETAGMPLGLQDDVSER